MPPSFAEGHHGHGARSYRDERQLVRSLSKWSMRPHEDGAALVSTVMAAAAAQHMAHELKQRNIGRVGTEFKAVKVHTLRNANSGGAVDVSEASMVDYRSAGKGEWRFAEYSYHGSYTSSTIGREVEEAAPIAEGMTKLKGDLEGSMGELRLEMAQAIAQVGQGEKAVAEKEEDG